MTDLHRITDTKTFDAYRSGFWAFHYDRFIAWKTGNPQRTEEVTYTAMAYVQGNAKIRLEGTENGPVRIKPIKRRWARYFRYW